LPIDSGTGGREGDPEMTDAAPATPPPTPAATAWGPKGKVRSPAAVIIFSIITLGIYYVVWIFKTFSENKEFSGQGMGAGPALVLAILGWFTGIFLIPLWFLLPSEIGIIEERMGQRKRVRGVTGFWNLIPILGFIIWVVKVQGAMNRLYE
jgi:Domain of unknown function (DUF4234)